jgi:transcriptional regulator of heat shock response
LCRRSAVGGKTSNEADTYKTISVYQSVDCCNERSMASQVANLNVERQMALLQKEETDNRKKILELEHALKENEEIMEGISNNSVAGGQRRFCGMDKIQSQYHSERDLENDERGLIAITSLVNQKTNCNVYPGIFQQDLDVKLLLAIDKFWD